MDDEEVTLRVASSTVDQFDGVADAAAARGGGAPGSGGRGWPSGRRAGALALAAIAALVAALAGVSAALVASQRSGGGGGAPGGAASLGARNAVTLLVVGDWGRQGTEQVAGARANQTAVAAAMEALAAREAARGAAHAVVSVGDNFYDDGLTGCDDGGFEESFSGVYSGGALLAARWDAVLGNHDFRGDVAPQLGECLTRRDGRWRAHLDAHIAYSSADGDVEVHAVMLDTSTLISEYLSCPGKHTYDFDDEAVGGPAAGASPGEVAAHRARRLASIGAALAEGAAASAAASAAGKASWLLAVGHHPVRSNSHHRDELDLMNHLDELLWKHGVDAYLAGHEHDLQHITRPYCCAFDAAVSGEEELDTLGEFDDGDGNCDTSQQPRVRYPDVGSAPYGSDEPGARHMHYVVTGAGSKIRHASHPGEPLPPPDKYGSFFHTGPGFVSVEAEGKSLRFVYRDTDARVLHTRALSR